MITHAKYLARAGVISLFALSLVACTPGGGEGQAPTPTPIPPQPTGTPTTEPTSEPTPSVPADDMVEGKANVESVELLMLESFPVQVRAIVKGYFPDACTRLGEVTQRRDGNTFEVNITTMRSKGAMCAQVITPFEENIALDVVGLKAGAYKVNVNGVTTEFTLDADNVLP